jgi:phosphatidylserine decarboxylase
MIHREGRISLFLGLLISAILITGFNILLPGWVSIAWILAIVFMGFLLQFFRNPQRKIPVTADNILLSPADGKVVVIEETTESEYFNDKRIQLSIFMSPTNVHANRNPVSGNILYSKYHPGKYLVAWHPKSSTENERTTIVYESGKSKILMRQIAGAVARRIVNYLKEGQEVQKGAEMGFIKFGSRVDLFLPIGTKIEVSLNQNVVAGITPIATLLE